jgi:RNA polymerase sigma-70 factor (ECF subfamily)
MKPSVPLEPVDLLLQARDGDQEALGKLLGHYSNYLWVLSRVQVGKRLQGKVDPADLVQETFLEAHRHFSTFRGQTEPELVSWLRQILGGVLSNLLRRYLGTKRRNILLEREIANEMDQSSQAIGWMPVDPGPTPSKNAAQRERGVMLANALGRLPEDYRDVIILRYLEDLPFAEVAERMGRSVDSVQKLWVRGLAQLRKSLNEEG